MLVLQEEGPSSFRLPHDTEGPRHRTVEGFEEGRQRRKRQQEGVQGQVLQVWQGSHVEGLQVQRSECIRSMHRALMPVSEMNDDGTRNVPRSDAHQGVCVRRGQWREVGAREMDGVIELPVEVVPYSQSTLKNSNSGTYSSLSGTDRECDGQSTQIDQGMQCSKSHSRSAVGSSRRRRKFWKSRCGPPDSRRWTVGRKTSGPRRAREDTTSRGQGRRVSRMVSVLRGWQRKEWSSPTDGSLT